MGSLVAELERLYPDARRSGSQLVVVEAPSPLGANGRIAIVTAYLQNGIAGAYRFYVGAAGE